MPGVCQPKPHFSSLGQFPLRTARSNRFHFRDIVPVVRLGTETRESAKVWERIIRGAKKVWKAKGKTDAERVISTAMDLKTIYDASKKKEEKKIADMKKVQKMIKQYETDRKKFEKSLVAVNGPKFARIPRIDDSDSDAARDEFQSVVAKDMSALKKAYKKMQTTKE